MRAMFPAKRILSSSFPQIIRLPDYQITNMLITKVLDCLIHQMQINVLLLSMNNEFNAIASYETIPLHSLCSRGKAGILSEMILNSSLASFQQFQPELRLSYGSLRCPVHIFTGWIPSTSAILSPCK